MYEQVLLSYFTFLCLHKVVMRWAKEFMVRGKKQQKNKEGRCGSGEMAQSLRVLAVLPEDVVQFSTPMSDGSQQP